MGRCVLILTIVFIFLTIRTHSRVAGWHLREDTVAIYQQRGLIQHNLDLHSNTVWPLINHVPGVRLTYVTSAHNLSDKLTVIEIWLRIEIHRKHTYTFGQTQDARIFETVAKRQPFLKILQQGVGGM